LCRKDSDFYQLGVRRFERPICENPDTEYVFGVAIGMAARFSGWRDGRRNGSFGGVVF
jgi:hypothetical protein